MFIRGAAAAILLSSLSALSAPAQIRLAAPGLQEVQVDEKVADFYNDYFAEQLREQAHAQVTTKSEVGALLGFERQKQLLGCAEGSQSCLAEMAGALGVDGIVTGSLAKLGTSYTIQIKILKASNGELLFAQSARLQTDDDLQDWLRDQAKAFGRQTSKSEAGEVGIKAPGSSSTGMRTWAIIPAAVGAAAAVGGVVFFLKAQGAKTDIQNNRSTDRSNFNEAVTRGENNQNLARVFSGVAVAGLATAAVMYVLGAPEPSGASVSLGLTRDSAAVALTWRLP